MATDRRRFETTRWSVVLAAQGESAGAREALNALCRAYWPPLYAYIRRWGHDPDRAADLTQAFFAELLGREDLKAVDPARGRFRTFLLACCRNFLCKDRRREAARGPAPIAIDARDAERGYRLEPADSLTPEQLFDRRWALSVLERALGSLREEYRRAGKAALFERLEPTLAGEPVPGGHAAAARELGLSEGAVHVAAHRLRRRYREAIRRLIAETVADPEQVEDELHELFRALARPTRGADL
jgi:RNA polymerase sigma-70 factor (ECF subfamily)